MLRPCYDHAHTHAGAGRPSLRSAGRHAEAEDRADGGDLHLAHHGADQAQADRPHCGDSAGRTRDWNPARAARWRAAEDALYRSEQPRY